MDEATYQKGLAMYEKHDGSKYPFEAPWPSDPPSFKDVGRASMSHSYGDSWTRNAIDMKTRSWITITLLASYGTNPGELKRHIRRAMRSGITKDELVDWIIHLNTYLGVPRTREPARLCREVWKEAAEAAATATSSANGKARAKKS